MNPQEHTRIPEEVVARQVGDEMVMLHLANGTYYSLDAVGARIWQLLEQGTPVQDVCDALMAEYEVTRETLERDIADFVQDLSSRGLVINA